nr:Phosphoethanolamine transferase EptA specific for the 1 phosphate group of core-lipid A [Escherichia coli]
MGKYAFIKIKLFRMFFWHCILLNWRGVLHFTKSLQIRRFQVVSPFHYQYCLLRLTLFVPFSIRYLIKPFCAFYRTVQRSYDGV